MEPLVIHFLSLKQKSLENENPNEFYLWDFDSRNSLTIVGGYKFFFQREKVV